MFEPAPAPVFEPAAEPERPASVFSTAPYDDVPVVASPPTGGIPAAAIAAAALAAPRREATMAPPPPPAAPAPAEFDRPLAPPPSPAGPSSQPVVPADAHPAPAARVSMFAPTEPLLPTRSPSRGPDGGPDRLASFGSEPTTSASSPSALQAALAAFDSRRSSEGGTLPTRPRSEEYATDEFGDGSGAAQSRLDPEALRERLRAFQSEFRTGAADATDQNQLTNNADLGGDRR